MECGSWSDLELRFQKDGTLEDAHPPFAEVHRIGWVGVNEGAGGNKLGTLGVGELFSSRRWREDVGKDEESECDTETSAKHSAENKDRNAAPNSVHESLGG